MCPLPTKRPLYKVRKAQVIISLASLPCAIASIKTSHGCAESWTQLAAIIVSLVIPLPILYLYRKGKKQISALEVLIDGLVTVLLFGTYIGGIVVIATRQISRYDYPYTYRIGRAIPQIYSNLSCLILAFLWLGSFAKGLCCLYTQHRLRAYGGVTYVLCPSCGQSPDAPANQDLGGAEQGQARLSTSTENIPTWYRDQETEAAPVIRGQGAEEGKQESGTTTVPGTTSA